MLLPAELCEIIPKPQIRSAAKREKNEQLRWQTFTEAVEQRGIHAASKSWGLRKFVGPAVTKFLKWHEGFFENRRGPITAQEMYAKLISQPWIVKIDGAGTGGDDGDSNEKMYVPIVFGKDEGGAVRGDDPGGGKNRRSRFMDGKPKHNVYLENVRLVEVEGKTDPFVTTKMIAMAKELNPNIEKYDTFVIELIEIGTTTRACIIPAEIGGKFPDDRLKRAISFVDAILNEMNYFEEPNVLARLIGEAASAGLAVQGTDNPAATVAVTPGDIDNIARTALSVNSMTPENVNEFHAQFLKEGQLRGELESGVNPGETSNPKEARAIVKRDNKRTKHEQKIKDLNELRGKFQRKLDELQEKSAGTKPKEEEE